MSINILSVYLFTKHRRVQREPGIALVSISVREQFCCTRSYTYHTPPANVIWYPRHVEKHEIIISSYPSVCPYYTTTCCITSGQLFGAHFGKSTFVESVPHPYLRPWFWNAISRRDGTNPTQRKERLDHRHYSRPNHNCVTVDAGTP